MERPEARRHGRFKRQKTSNTESRIDPHMADTSDDSDGGVKLDGHYGQPTTLKEEAGDSNSRQKTSVDSANKLEKTSKKRVRSDTEEHLNKPRKRESYEDSEPRSSKRYKEEDDLEPESNRHQAHQYAKPKKDEADPKSNPYLAHMYEEDNSYNDYSNGYGKAASRAKVFSDTATVARLPRHKTTAAMAKKAEDGPNNPFTGKPLSSQYFNILKTRRNLPVHAQRLVYLKR